MVFTITKQVKEFLEPFDPTDFANDPLPIKVYRSSISKEEAVGQGVHWAMEYLYIRLCPAELMDFTLRFVYEEINEKITPEFSYKSTNGTGSDEVDSNNETSMEPLNLMRYVVTTVDEILVKIKNVTSNEELEEKFPELCRKSKNLESQLSEELTFVKSMSYFSMKNQRRIQEDKVVVLPHFHDVFNLEKPSSYFAVFDGHNGIEAASYAAAQLHQYLIEAMENTPCLTEAFTSAFSKTDKAFMEKCNSEKIRSGATAVAAFIDINIKKIYIAWVGDSQASLGYGGGKCIQLVSGHRPTREDERERITRMGGEVLKMGDMLRVNGTLAVTRSIGDADFKDCVISAPEILEINVECIEAEYMVLASDGLWDVMNSKDVQAIIEKAVLENAGQEAAKQLANSAKSKGSEDNTSVIVLYFQSMDQLQSLIKNRSETIIEEAEYGSLGVYVDTHDVKSEVRQFKERSAFREENLLDTEPSNESQLTKDEIDEDKLELDELKKFLPLQTASLLDMGSFNDQTMLAKVDLNVKTEVIQSNENGPSSLTENLLNLESFKEQEKLDNTDELEVESKKEISDLDVCKDQDTLSNADTEVSQLKENEQSATENVEWYMGDLKLEPEELQVEPKKFQRLEQTDEERRAGYLCHLLDNHLWQSDDGEPLIVPDSYGAELKEELQKMHILREQKRLLNLGSSNDQLTLSNFDNAVVNSEVLQIVDKIPLQEDNLLDSCKGKDQVTLPESGKSEIIQFDNNAPTKKAEEDLGELDECKDQINPSNVDTKVVKSQVIQLQENIQAENVLDNQVSPNDLVKLPNININGEKLEVVEKVEIKKIELVQTGNSLPNKNKDQVKRISVGPAKEKSADAKFSPAKGRTLSSRAVGSTVPAPRPPPPKKIEPVKIPKTDIKNKIVAAAAPPKVKATTRVTATTSGVTPRPPARPASAKTPITSPVAPKVSITKTTSNTNMTVSKPPARKALPVVKSTNNTTGANAPETKVTPIKARPAASRPVIAPPARPATKTAAVPGAVKSARTESKSLSNGTGTSSITATSARPKTAIAGSISSRTATATSGSGNVTRRSGVATSLTRLGSATSTQVSSTTTTTSVATRTTPKKVTGEKPKPLTQLKPALANGNKTNTSTSKTTTVVGSKPVVGPKAKSAVSGSLPATKAKPKTEETVELVETKANTTPATEALAEDLQNGNHPEIIQENGNDASSTIPELIS